MRDANIAIVTGNLARDPEVRYTTSNMAVAHFTVAANRGMRNGEDMGADFINVTAWGKTAEAIEKYLRKGDKVLVRGSIRIDAYESAGQKRYKTYVSAEQIQFLKTKQNTIPGETLEGPAFVRQEDQDTVDIPF